MVRGGSRKYLKKDTFLFRTLHKKRRFSYFEVALTLPALLSFRTVSPRHCACAMTARSWLVLRGRALSNLAACMLQMPRSEIAVGWPSEAPQRDLAASCTEAELRCAM